MALTVTNAYEKANSNSIPSYDAGSEANRVLVVVVGMANGGSQNVTAVTYGGQAMTLSGRVTDPDSWSEVTVFYHTSPPSGSNTFTVTSGDNASAAFFACVITGGGAVSVGNSASNSGNSTSPGVSITPQAANSLFIGGVTSGTDSTAITSRLGSTIVNEIANTGNYRAAMVSLPASSTSAHTFGATAANDFWAIYALEIKEATGTTVTPGVVNLTTSTYAPVVSATAHKTVIPGVANLSISTFAPIARIGITVEVPNATLTLTTFAPIMLTPVVVTPVTADLTLTGFAPTVIATDLKVVTPPTVTLTTTLYAPVVSVTLLPQPLDSLVIQSVTDQITVRGSQDSITVRSEVDTLRLTTAADALTVRGDTDGQSITQAIDRLSIQTIVDNLTVRG